MHFYFDETKFKIDGIEYLALAGVLIEEQNMASILSHLEALKTELEEDQFLGKKEENRLLHFTEDNLEIQPKVIECLREQKVKVYIAYKILGDDYQDTYNNIMTKILFDRFQKNHTYKFTINYEENTYIKPTKLAKAIDNISKVVQERKPTFTGYTLVKVNKTEPFNAIPDYFLGVFRQYIVVDTRQDYMKRNFEKLRKKIRLILDMENDIFYHKDNPYKKYS